MEAIQSFRWSLEQSSNTEHFWLYNPLDKAELAAKELIAIALCRSSGQPRACQLAEDCLKIAESIQP